ncbi:sigma 54-interacting transcriptional regulator [candidate division KSB1 bacterium]|nr:sigma 54-interacting transcriptional regulator [candidate division KSB1 bacterium]
MTINEPESLYLHITRHEKELSVLYKIAHLLATKTDYLENFKKLLNVLDDELSMRRGTIMLLSPDGRELFIEAIGNPIDGLQSNVTYRKGEGITGKVLESGTSAIIPNISAEPEFKDRIYRRFQTNVKENSFICVPIMIGNEVVGTISVDLVYESQGLLSDSERVLSIVAGMIANDVKARRRRLQEKAELEAENFRLRSQLEERYRPENIVGNSHAMREVYVRIHQVSKSATTSVLIRGESGTGKELVASAIHYASPRSDKPFVKVNCAALNENVLESELFGHKKGAFTGALYERKGRIEETDGGTLFLDEIGDFTPAIQTKLLRVLQEREFERVGSNKTIKVNVRIIAATNRNLEKSIAEGLFREDLYYRINVFPIFLPPLRERRSDILQLADHFVQKYAAKLNKNVTRISTPAINMILAYHWPGNVRELENCIEHGVLVCNDESIHGYNLPPTLQVPGDIENSPEGTLKARIQLLEKDIIVDALKRTNGNVSAAAREIGYTPRMVRYKIKNLRIDYDGLFKRMKRRQ